jgi:hypothetical protein
MHMMHGVASIGAILSVPLLGVIKILLNETDHPMAKRLLVRNSTHHRPSSSPQAFGCPCI